MWTAGKSESYKRGKMVKNFPKSSGSSSMQSSSPRTHKTDRRLSGGPPRTAPPTGSPPPSTAESPLSALRNRIVAHRTGQMRAEPPRGSSRNPYLSKLLSALTTHGPGSSNKATAKGWMQLWSEPAISTHPRWTKTWMLWPRICKTFWRNRTKWLRKRRTKWASSSPRSSSREAATLGAAGPRQASGVAPSAARAKRMQAKGTSQASTWANRRVDRPSPDTKRARRAKSTKMQTIQALLSKNSEINFTQTKTIQQFIQINPIQ